MRKLRMAVFGLIVLFIITFTVACVSSQNTAQKTTNFKISSNGTFIASESSIGVSYKIYGAPGTQGNVTSIASTTNPQPTATIPKGAVLTYFLVITFDVNQTNFRNATVTITYNDSNVTNIQPPFAIYKYSPDGNFYVKVPSVSDVNAKTIATKLPNTSDPLIAIGNDTSPSPQTTSSPNNTISTSTWIIIIVVIIAILLSVAYIVALQRNRAKSKRSANENG